jgi:phospholipase C
MHLPSLKLAVAAAVLAAAACTNASPVPSGVTPAENLASRSRSIQHIVIVVQEARSFDNLFCGYAGAQSKCKGLQSIPLEANCTLSDTFQDFERDRKTGKFGKEHADCPGYRRPEYAYVPHSELTPYYAIAQQYVLGDQMFSSTGNPTYEAHQYLIAAQAGNAENQPFGNVPPAKCVYHRWVHQFGSGKVEACSSYRTLAENLDAKGLSWRYYRTADPSHPIVDTWDAYGWIAGGKSGTSPSSRFITDVGSGKLASVTWVTPSFADSDLSGSLSACGPSWVAAVVNAVGESQFWNTSAIVILWSGFGGWYDNVPPQWVDREGLGFRVPVLVVSPFARTGEVTHVHFETGSVLKFVEDTFALPRLSRSDTRAQSLALSTLDLHQKPRTFLPIEGGGSCGGR